MREGGVVGEGWGGEAKAQVGDMYVPGILRALLLLFLSRGHYNVLVVVVVLPVVVWWWWVVSAACTRGGEADDACGEGMMECLEINCQNRSQTKAPALTNAPSSWHLSLALSLCGCGWVGGWWW